MPANPTIYACLLLALLLLLSSSLASGLRGISLRLGARWSAALADAEHRVITLDSCRSRRAASASGGTGKDGPAAHVAHGREKAEVEGFEAVEDDGAECLVLQTLGDGQRDT